MKYQNYRRFATYILILGILISCMGFRAPQMDDGAEVFGQQETASNITEVLQSKPCIFMCTDSTASRYETGRPTQQMSRMGNHGRRCAENMMPVPVCVMQSLVFYIAVVRHQIFQQIISSAWILRYIHQQDGKKPYTLLTAYA